MNITDLSVSDKFINAYGQREPKNSYGTEVKVAALKAASYLTGPICKVREYYYCLYTLDETCDSTEEKVGKAALLVLGIGVCVLLTPLTAPIGAVIRAIVVALQSKPYIYLEKEGLAKVLPEDRKFTIVSHNQCYMPAGYSISDGQVTPPSDKVRMDANIKKVKKLDPDVICLYEVPDICDADYISSELPDHPFVIPVAGPRAIGPSSMMYVASKYQIVEESIEFIPFVKGVEVTGRAQHSEKGFLSFDLVSHGSKDPFATIISTHLQHSEIPTDPDPVEIESRKRQLNKIARQIDAKSHHEVVLTGDLNLEEKELNPFFTLQRDKKVIGKPTWNGDKWCANLMGKAFSDPLVLDYTFIAGKTSTIFTKIKKMKDYSSSQFKPKALSDHNLLFSTIGLMPTYRF
jgi:hypothetical protein